MMPCQLPEAADPLSELQPSRIQFIQKIFPDLLGPTANWRGSADLGRSSRETLRWVHDRLFLEGWQVAAVRAELFRSRENVRAIAVTSGKGGVGKTTFSVNLAAACSMQGRRVLLFDADLGLANAHVFAGVNPKATILDVIDGHAALTDVVVQGPGGIHLVCGASGVGRLANLDARILEALGRELMQIAADFDVLIIDTGAGVSPTVTHFLGLAQEIVVITTPNLAATLDAYGLIKVAHESGLKTRMQVLVNQAEDFTEASAVLARIVGCASRFLQTTPGDLGFLQRDPAFEQSNQQRQPLVLAHPGNVNAMRIAAIATQLAAVPKRVASPSGQWECDLPISADNRQPISST